jgi:hypothetical protein
LGDCGGTAELDDCGVCEGDNTCNTPNAACDLPSSDTIGYLYLAPDDTIWYKTPVPIGGFQFIIAGDGTLNSAYGGTAEEAGFTVMPNSETGLVLGFSLDGSSISDCGVLTIIDYTGEAIRNGRSIK